MGLGDLLESKREAITKAWLERTLESYPKDAAAFFRREKNRFANPVGQRLADGITDLYGELIAGADPQRLCEQLDPVMQLRSVQDFTPARAVCFVFDLKDVLRKLLRDELRQPAARDELVAFESRIDQLALYAFDIYTKYRQRMYELRVEEIKRRVAGLMRRSGMFVEDAEERLAPVPDDEDDDGS
jgi:hypothetical protein